MKPVLRYLAVGVAAYLLILVVTVPATYFRDKLQDSLPGLGLGNLSGSVFSGQSDRVNFLGQELGPVEWGFRPFALLLLRIEYRLTFSHPDNSGHVTMGIKPGSDVYGRDLDIQLSPGRLINRFSPVELHTRGSLDLLLDHFEYTDKGLRAVAGTVLWQDAAIESPLVLPLGELGLVLESRDDTLVATVTEGGDLGVSGEILLQPGDRYALDLVLRPGSNVSTEVRSMLGTAMVSDTAGGYLLKTTGGY